ncbi:hypothetical protein [Actinoplanes sp. NPDC026619]|uniref:hypothetical protein n=1 Tax=Actinoplanes sp. NPDC026619 TaxID=3155798 RepID=UPI0033D6F336
MSRRFRGVLPLVLVTVAALAAGCDDKSTPEAAPVATAPVPSPSAALSPSGPASTETCSAVIKIVIDGSVGIADDAVKSIDEHWSRKKVDDNMRTRFRAMSEKVAAEAPQISDPELKAAVQKTADELAAGAKSSKPETFLKKDFQTLGKDLDSHCKS